MTRKQITLICINMIIRHPYSRFDESYGWVYYKNNKAFIRWLNNEYNTDLTLEEVEKLLVLL
jgi:hypothetical protein